MTALQGRCLDIALLGATGFVGKLTAEYLSRSAPEGVRIGLAGRNLASLEGVRASLGRRALAWPLIEADSTDDASLAALARATRVVITTAGPYRHRGLGLVAAYCAAGTDYVDITGEVLFMRESIDRYHEAAAAAGARVVHACGFDSIPSDLGTLLLHQAADSDGSGKLGATTLVVAALRGSLSGGKFASIKGTVDDVKRDRASRRILGDPYALSPDRSAEPKLGNESDLRGVRHDATLDTWIGPFLMASTNTRVVRRSNALQRWAYGRRFRYREVTKFGSGVQAPLRAAGMSAVLAGLIVGLAAPLTRPILERFLPKPGEGPSPEMQRDGYFRMELHATTARGARYAATVGAQGDPGYAATAVMLGECALCLVLDRERLPRRSGVLTPATALGEPLVQRLRAAGHTYSVTRKAA